MLAVYIDTQHLNVAQCLDLRRTQIRWFASWTEEEKKKSETYPCIKAELSEANQVQYKINPSHLKHVYVAELTAVRDKEDTSKMALVPLQD